MPVAADVRYISPEKVLRDGRTVYKNIFRPQGLENPGFSCSFAPFKNFASYFV
jgi:hypothetical protein